LTSTAASASVWFGRGDLTRAQALVPPSIFAARDHADRRAHGFTRRQVVELLAAIPLVTALGGCGEDADTGTPPLATDHNHQEALVAQLGVVGLIVRDVARSLDFYRQVGLDIPEGQGGSNFRMQLPGGLTFFWDNYDTTRQWVDPNWTPSSGNRRVVLEFGFPTPQAVNDKYAELVAAGYESYIAPRDVDGAQYAMVKDPDDNEIGLRYPPTG
jgi:catechol 2,3-dioxygenase-like lactoylglutathione lyase family enzyme